MNLKLIRSKSLLKSLKVKYSKRKIFKKISLFETKFARPCIFSLQRVFATRDLLDLLVLNGLVQPCFTLIDTFKI